ncbi:zinc finger C2HC domain-containing protein 1B [Egretta garzetta]|uniref:zinc finger C2HC domain-containing protein 1B n=1 Tax=Egretta garzetta TaxID=188379 RepID=UPI00163BF0C1|nr:zinc finger C2HC domain-containing protein 1B [Egretta garzetta]
MATVAKALQLQQSVTVTVAVEICFAEAILYCLTETLAWFEFYTAARSQSLAPCTTCGRRFAQDVLLRHVPICKKVFNKKRKPFNSLKQRLQGTEITTVRKQPPQKKKPGKKSNWRQHHEDFINAIRSAKQVTKALKEGHPLPPPPPPSINPDYIQCPHCSRRFNEAAAERHIKFCEEQAARRAFAAKATGQALGKQPVTQRKPPTLMTSALPLQKRVQEDANTSKPRPETSPRIQQKTRKSLGVSTGKKTSGEFG